MLLGKCHHETVVRGIAQNLSSVGSKWLNRGSMQQQQHQDKPPQATSNNHGRKKKKRKVEEKERREERVKKEVDRKGERRKKRKLRMEVNRSKNDVTGWTEVTRKKRRRTVQIFVKMDGGKTSAMEMEMNDKGG